EVGFFFILLDVEPVGPPKHAPVEVPRIVAGGVLAMLGELDAEPLVGAGVQPRDEPLDDAAGHQRKVLHARQRRGVQVLVSSIAAHRSWNLLRRAHSVVSTPAKTTQKSRGK